MGFTGHGTQAAALCLSVVPCAVAKKSAEPAAADVAAQEAAVEMVAKGVLNPGGEVWDGMEGFGWNSLGSTTLDLPQNRQPKYRFAGALRKAVVGTLRMLAVGSRVEIPIPSLMQVGMFKK